MTPSEMVLCELNEKIKYLQQENLKLKQAYEILREGLLNVDEFLCEHIIDPCGYDPEVEAIEDLIITIKNNSANNDIMLTKIRQKLQKADEVLK
jgi:hypothetical protein